jgi:hypothetical protein
VRAALLLAAVFASPAGAQDIDPQLGLILRDQMTAEFAAGARRGELEALHRDQVREARSDPHPGQRARMAREREQLLLRPLPLPGRSDIRLDPIPLKGFGG